VAEASGSPIGHVRVSPQANGAAEIHVVLASDARGRGLGAAVLVQASARALADSEVALLCAHVKPENQASLRTFARAGFHPVGSDADGLVRLERSTHRAEAMGRSNPT
jgi:RimJ/RimL family protein N-acetyltransferase